MPKIKKSVVEIPQPDVIPMDGMSRWSDIKNKIPVSRERWRQLSNEGKAPPVLRMGIRCSFQSNREIHRWLSDPLNYKVESI